MCKFEFIRKVGFLILRIDCRDCSRSSSFSDSRCVKGVQCFLGEGVDCIVLDNGIFRRILYKDEFKNLNKRKCNFVVQPSFVDYYFRKVSGEKLDDYSVNSDRVSIIKDASSIFYCIYPKELALSVSEVKSVTKNLGKVSNIELPSDFCKAKESIFSLDFPLPELIFRYSIGFGVFEVPFSDSLIQDIYIDSPGDSCMYVVHETFGICKTNIFVGEGELAKFCASLRMFSGRAFNEACPVINANIPFFSIRATGIMQPLTFNGVGFAFRRHSLKPFTLYSLVSAGTFSSEVAALLSFLVQCNKSFLITGCRGSGKTTLLSALLAEVCSGNRILIIEDTPEIPVDDFKHAGFCIQHLRIKQPLSVNSEFSAVDAIRTALRLGESVLVLGEVRGEEARALFEAMRIGATGSVVLGTIHGSSVFDTFDRIVNDLHVPPSSFKAVDVVVCLGFRSFNGKKEKVLTSIYEVRKGWLHNPFSEDGFYELVRREGEKLVVNDLSKSELFNNILRERCVSLEDIKRELSSKTEYIDFLKGSMLDFNEIIRFNLFLNSAAQSDNINLDRLLKTFREDNNV